MYHIVSIPYTTERKPPCSLLTDVDTVSAKLTDQIKCLNKDSNPSLTLNLLLYMILNEIKDIVLIIYTVTPSSYNHACSFIFCMCWRMHFCR